MEIATPNHIKAAARRPHTRRSRLLDDLRFLASPELEGRRSGTRGAARALQFIRGRYADLGLTPVFPAYQQPFVFRDIERKTTQGVNVVGLRPGHVDPDSYIV